MGLTTTTSRDYSNISDAASWNVSPIHAHLSRPGTKKNPFAPPSALKNVTLSPSLSGSQPPSPNIESPKVHFDMYIVSDVWEAPKFYDRRMNEETMQRIVAIAERRKARHSPPKPLTSSSPQSSPPSDLAFPLALPSVDDEEGVEAVLLPPSALAVEEC